MEESLNTQSPEFPWNQIWPKKKARQLNPLTLAFIGDSVYSDAVRRYFVAEGLQNVNHLTRETSRIVKASAQAKAIHFLLPYLSEEEKRIVIRGRNTKSIPPKHADKTDYRFATGFEALLGYLSLTGQKKRLDAVINRSIIICQ